MPWAKTEPYRLFFPLGILLSWAGVGHWLLHALGVLEDYRSIFHAMTQIQGFLMCFAVGFLFTMIPRRTGTPPPATAELAIGAAAPIVTVVAAWLGMWAVAQTAWLVLAVTIIRFAVIRFRSKSAARKPPNGFVWIPVAFAFGIAGSILSALGGIFSDRFWAMHQLGTRLVLQAMFISLVLGVGGLALPLMTRGEAPLDATTTPRDRRVRAAHLLLALCLLASFLIEQWISLPFAMALRGAVVLAVLLASAELWKRPSQPGWNRRSMWIAAWSLPLGYFLAALFPLQYKAGLHVTFIGGFALLAMSVGAHVILGHGDFKEELRGRPRAVVFIGAMMAAAIVFRGLMDFDPDCFFVWMALASFSFLSSTGAWMLYLLPKTFLRTRMSHSIAAGISALLLLSCRTGVPPAPAGLPPIARQAVASEMRGHADAMSLLFWSVLFLDDQGVSQIAAAISAEPKFARVHVSEEDTVNAMLPDPFFVFQDELQTKAKALLAVATAPEHDAAAIGRAYGELATTCVKCHERYLYEPGERPSSDPSRAWNDTRR